MLYVCVWTQCPGHGMTQDTGHCDGSLLGAIFALTILLLLAGQVQVTRGRADLATRRRQERQFTDSWAQDITLLVKVRRVYNILYTFLLSCIIFLGITIQDV